MTTLTLAQASRSASPWARQVYMAEAKAGKTTWLVASLLGALPHQTESVVDSPANLHVLGCDEAFADGLGEFITGACKKPESMLAVSLYPLDDLRKQSGSQTEYDFRFHNAVAAAAAKIEAATSKPGIHAVVVSSLTGLAEGLYSGLAGPPGTTLESGKVSKGGGMDVSKWQDLERQFISLRNRLQSGTRHVFWEAHVAIDKKLEGGKEVTFETVEAGKGGGAKSFSANVEYVFRLRREAAKHPGTVIDKCFIDTKPSLGTFVSGRKALLLDDKETDLAVILKKLGKKTNGKPL